VLPDGPGFSPSVLPIVGVFWVHWFAVVVAVLPRGVVVCASVVVGAKISFWAPEVVFTSGTVLAGSEGGPGPVGAPGSSGDFGFFSSDIYSCFIEKKNFGFENFVSSSVLS
jgi:hypothetical protein